MNRPFPDPRLVSDIELYQRGAAAGWCDTFEILVGRLKRSAIDAYVCDEYRRQPHSDLVLWIEEDGYYAVYGAGDEPGGMFCTRPDRGGRGGGRKGGVDVAMRARWPGSSGKSMVDLVGAFAAIRHEIDDIVAPWRNYASSPLPDPEDIALVVESWRTIYRDMSDRAERPDTGAGSLRANLGRIWDMIHGRGAEKEPMQGSMIETFSAYVDNLRVAVDCCWDASLVLGTAIAGEQELWKRAREDCISVLCNTIHAFDELARTSDGTHEDIQQYFTVAGVLLGAVGLFGGPIGAVATVAGIGLTLVGEATGSPAGANQQVAVPDAWGLLQGLRQLLGDGSGSGLSGRIETEERAIRSNLVENLQTLDENRSALDPTPEPIMSTTGIIRTDPALTDYIVDRLMPAVGDELDRISQLIGNSAREVHDGSTDLLKRDRSIGDGPTGPSDAFLDLAYRLRSALGELCLEVEYGARNLRAAADALEQCNDAAEQALRRSAVLASEPVVSVLNLSRMDGFRF